MNIRPGSFLLLFLLCFSALLNAQSLRPVGQWQTYPCHKYASCIEKVGNKIYSANESLLEYDMDTKEYWNWSKVNGLSDVNIQFMRYDSLSNYMVIVYENGNIDLFRNNSFSNISDIKSLNITGSKRINHALFKNNLIYLSTDFAIVVINPEKREVKESYVLQKGSNVAQVKDLCSINGYFYAATSVGIFKASETNPALQNFANWTLISDTATSYIFKQQQQLYCTNEKRVFKIEADTLVTIGQTVSPISNVRLGKERFYVCQQSDALRNILVFDGDGALIDTILFINPNDVIEIGDNEVWVADGWDGMVKVLNSQDRYFQAPNGRFSRTMQKLVSSGNDLYICAGGSPGWQPAFNTGGISRLRDGEWTTFNRYTGITALDTVGDIINMVVDKKTNYIYAASFGDGLVELHPDNTVVVYKKGFVESQIGNEGSYRVTGLALDDDRNLWISSYSAPHGLIVKKADGSWQRFTLPGPGSNTATNEIVIDDANQKWILAPRGTGLFVYNDNNTIDNINDDQSKLLVAGIGNGNLPGSEMVCMTKDKNGKIWVGTNDGIAIFNCPESVLTPEGCDAELKIVKYDLNAGLLFQREIVRTIAVDGANNKWIGTFNGVWLISDDAEKIIHRFTKDNSPLPSNEINSIAIQPNTGEVFIATNAGLVSYRAEATEGNETNDDLLIFPNPVPPNYEGMVAIKGLVENADVRITDVAGQLVYRTKAQGGQAVWDGKNYLGEKPRTGVYFVFVSNADGSQSKVGKFIYNE